MIALKPCQIWLPEPWSTAAPRQIKLLFGDVNGDAWLQWNYPGYPQRAVAVTQRSFRAWIRRNGAQPEGLEEVSPSDMTKRIKLDRIIDRYR